MEIKTGINITTIEFEDLWMVVENYSENKKLSVLLSFHITSEDYIWLKSSKVFEIYLLTNYESASSLILKPLAFLNQERLTKIFTEFIKRKHEPLNLQTNNN